MTPHREYKNLGKTDAERQSEYRQLFRSHIAEAALEEILEATNNAWVVGGERFKKRIGKNWVGQWNRLVMEGIENQRVTLIIDESDPLIYTLIYRAWNHICDGHT